MGECRQRHLHHPPLSPHPPTHPPHQPHNPQLVHTTTIITHSPINSTARPGRPQLIHGCQHVARLKRGSWPGQARAAWKGAACVGAAVETRERARQSTKQVAKQPLTRKSWRWPESRVRATSEFRGAKRGRVGEKEVEMNRSG